MILYIKNMVSYRCKMVVQSEMTKLGLYCISIEIGKVEIAEIASSDQIYKIRIALLQWGLELVDNKKSILIEKVKNIIIDMIYYSDYRLKTNFSDYLSEKLNRDYTYLANIFSEHQGNTIEHFVIYSRIQRIKELISQDELNLTEISWKMHYSSVAHLSAQFKKVTGVTPSQFKHLSCPKPLCA